MKEKRGSEGGAEEGGEDVLRIDANDTLNVVVSL